MEYTVFKESQNLCEALFETATEKDARDFCESHNWELKDENEFVWDLYYEKNQ